jgi:hypothetical protein
MFRSSVLSLALAAVTLAAAAPAAANDGMVPAPLEDGEVQLLALDQTVPLAAVLDNPCTAAVEAVAFEGSTHLIQEIRQTPLGLRLIIWERTFLQGTDTLLLGGSGPIYAVDAVSHPDVEFAPDSVSLYSHKKVLGTDDNFHAVLVLDFHPSSLQIDLRLEGACDNGLPTVTSSTTDTSSTGVM